MAVLDLKGGTKREREEKTHHVIVHNQRFLVDDLLFKPSTSQ